ncbi:MAG: hypothetical protein AB7J35_21245 [Dehalococcoidia bacterium]
MITTDELIFEAAERGLQACFEALNDLARDMPEFRKKQIHAKTERVQRASAQIAALLDERRAGLEAG